MWPKLFTSFFIISFLHGVSQDCYDSYSYHRVYHVSAPQGSGSLSPATHHLLFETASLVESGKLRSDGNDLRLTDQFCNPIPFYIQGFTERDTNVVYVSLPSLDENGMDIHFYYGHPEETVSSSDGDAVFLFFDDFEDGQLDDQRWETVGAVSTYAEVDGVLEFSGDNTTGGIFQYITPSQGISGPVTFDFVANSNNQRIYGIADTSDFQRIAFRYGTGAESVDSLNIIAQMNDTLSGGFNPGIVYPDVIVPRVEMNIISISAQVGPDNELMVTRFMNLSNLDANLDTLLNDAFSFNAVRPFFSAFSFSPIRVEFFGARMSSPALPDVVRGEETFIGVSALVDQEEGLRLNAHPNPGDGLVYLETGNEVLQGVEVFDMEGRLLLSSENSSVLDLTPLPRGVYIIQVTYAHNSQAMIRYVKD